PHETLLCILHPVTWADRDRLPTPRTATRRGRKPRGLRSGGESRRREVEDRNGPLGRSDLATGPAGQVDRFGDQVDIRRGPVTGEELEADVEMTTSFERDASHLCRRRVPTRDRHRPRDRAPVEHLEVRVEGTDGRRQAEG